MKIMSEANGTFGHRVSSIDVTTAALKGSHQ